MPVSCWTCNINICWVFPVAWRGICFLPRRAVGIGLKPCLWTFGGQDGCWLVEAAHCSHTMAILWQYEDIMKMSIASNSFQFCPKITSDFSQDFWLTTWHLTFLARPLSEAQPCSTCCALVLRHTGPQMKVHNINMNNISDGCRYMSLLLTYYVVHHIYTVITNDTCLE